MGLFTKPKLDYNRQPTGGTEPTGLGYALGVIGLCVVSLLLLIALFAGGKAFSRYQSRADRSQNRQQRLYDEQNNVQVNEIRIAQQDQLVKVAKQKAQIRYENAIGIRKAQDEISNTLTPLYVQFEMTQALQQIATSGQNNTVIYLPTNPANGLPAVTLNNPAVPEPKQQPTP